MHARLESDSAFRPLPPRRFLLVRSLFSALGLGSAAQAGLIGPGPGGPPPTGPLTEWGARVGGSTALCPSFCTSVDFAPSDGGPGSLSAETSFSDSRGNTQSRAVLDPGSGLSIPQLQSEAFVTGGGNSSAFGSAFAVEGYTYDGPEAKTFDLDITLTGSIFDPTPGDNDTTIRAEVYIFERQNFVFTSDLGTLLFEFFATEITSTTLNLTGGLISDTLTFELTPGQEIYLFALLDVDAERDLSSADAFSTLALSIPDPGGLTSASGGETS